MATPIEDTGDLHDLAYGSLKDGFCKQIRILYKVYFDQLSGGQPSDEALARTRTGLDLAAQAFTDMNLLLREKFSA